ncbi:hypothetical protein SAMN05216188_103136 [Lentzea xinjiangensis]|uniref:Uncharacterized protein n=1 Tax=Lentzea xinjiangensis TaxID=402600 RepID=A0A1H9GAA8_9PSEU|nr:hypothetical protein [Lentzea xinjiangensis]SEQ46990.1 hypothetical protein SAMN05216188_103136 [Lentzea xinjiangensis]
MARLSTTDQLADLRRTYTGENLSQAVPAVRSGELLPDAATEAQRQLEAKVLAAACTAASVLQLMPPASIIRPAHAFRTVEPGETVRLHLSDRALGPLLFELLPRTEAGFGMGVAGLRHEQHRRSAELTTGDAAVVLAGVDQAAWDAGMRYVRWMHEFRGVGHTDGGGNDEELAQAATGSALLRRVHLWHEASWLRALPMGEAWFVEWAGGPAEAEVRERLRHPDFGTTADIALRRIDAPTRDVEEGMRTYPWPEEFVSAVTAAEPDQRPDHR